MNRSIVLHLERNVVVSTVVDWIVSVGVDKCEEGLRLGQLMHVVHFNYVRRFKMSQIAVCLDFIV